MKTDEILSALKYLIDKAKNVRSSSSIFDDAVSNAEIALEYALRKKAAPPERTIAHLSFSGVSGCIDSEGNAWRLIIDDESVYGWAWKRLPPIPQGDAS